jgi:hypothetical protein
MPVSPSTKVMALWQVAVLRSAGSKEISPWS